MITKNTFMQQSLIDTHCHLDLIIKGLNTPVDQPLTPEQLIEIGPIIQQAAAQQINTIITVSTTVTDSLDSIRIAQHYPSVYAAVGLHPTNLTAAWHDNLAQIEALLTQSKQNRIVALGETGLDLYHPGDFRMYQEEAFRAHIALAIAHKLPIIIHSRDAAPQTLAILNEYAHHGLRGILHCFAYDYPTAQHIIGMGLHLGVSCTLTRPNNRLRTFIKDIDLSHIVLETDAPFLPPQHLRDTTNVPINTYWAAHALVQCTGASLEMVAQITTNNARALFGI